MSQMKNFNSYSACKFDLTESQLADFDSLINKLFASEKFISFMKMLTDLREHVLKSDAHYLDMSIYDKELLSQLYIVYRNLGFSGSIQDMLFAIAKSVEIGHVEEGDYLGWSYLKAVNVPGWTFLFHDHIEKPNHTAFKYFDTPYFSNEPLYHFDHINGEILNSLDSGLILEYWNPIESHIYFDTTVDHHLNIVEIFEIDFLNSSFKVNINADTNCIDVFLNDEIILAHPFMQPELTSGKFILSYKDGVLSISDALNETTTGITLPSTALAMHVKQPFSRNHLNSLSYYTNMSEETKIHLFN